MRLLINKSIQYLNILVMGLIILSVNMMRVFEPIEGVGFNIALSDLLLPLFGILLLVSILRDKSLTPVKYLLWFLLLMVWLVLTNILAEGNQSLETADRMTVYGEWLKTLICIAYFYVGYQVLASMSLMWALRLYSMGYGIFLTYGFGTLWAMARGMEVPFVHDNAGRFFLGTYHDPNHAATYIGVSFFVLIYAYHKEKGWPLKLLSMTLALLSVPALILTDSRGGLLAYSAALLLYVLIMYYKRISSLLTLVLLLLLAVFAGLLFDSQVNDGRFIASLFSSFLNFDQGMDIRDGLRQTAWHMGLDHWLFGVGRGNYLMNSAAYFEALEIKFFDDIPHNTYVGVFAETGILGLILFAAPILILFAKFKDRTKDLVREWQVSKPFMASLMATVSVLAVQAYVLNMENRRTYWLLSGMLIYLVSKEWQQISVSEGSAGAESFTGLRLTKHSAFNILLAVVCLASFVYTANHAYMPKKEGWSSGDQRIELPVPAHLTGELIEVEYYLYAHQSNFPEQETLGLKIVEEQTDGTRQVLNDYIYPRTRGTCRLSFVKGREDSTIYLEVTHLSAELRAYRLWLRRLLSEEATLSFGRTYYLLEGSRATEAFYPPWEERNDSRYAAENFKPKLEALEAVTYEDLLQVEAVEVSGGDLASELRVTYRVLKDLKQDYVLWVYGNPENLHYLDASRFLANNEYYSPIEPVVTSEWKKDQLYEVTYPLPRDHGWHRLVAGIYYKDGDKTVPLIEQTTKRNYVILGWADYSKSLSNSDNKQ